MSDALSIQLFSKAVITDSLTELFKEDWWPGTVIKTASGDFGDVSVQSATVDGISMYYITACLMLDLQMQIEAVNHLFLIQIQFAGSHELKLGSENHNLNKPNYYSFLFYSRLPLVVKLPKQSNYKFLVLAYPLTIIRSVLLYYPPLYEIKDKLDSKNSILYKSQLASPTLLEEIYKLLHTPYTPLMEEFFLSTFKEILHTAFAEYNLDVQQKIPFTMHDISIIHAAKEYIDSHISEHHTIAQIARAVGTNQLKLKKGFKAIYGIGVYGYFLQQRLLIASAALEKTTKPVHQIARQAGYKSIPNFSAAFRRVFGISPYKYRLEKRK